MFYSNNLRNGVTAPSIICGTFQLINEYDINKLVRVALENGFRAFDTAPSYGNESVLGSTISACISDGIVERNDLFLIDKIDGWQMQDSKGQVRPYVEDAIRKLKVQYLDLLLIHWPFPEYLLKTWETFTNLYESGLVRSVGMCNVQTRHLDILRNQSLLVPHIIQIERHPLCTSENIIKYCVENDIGVQAYSPVCRMITRLSDSELITDLSQKYQKTKGQIIMRWHLDTNVAPVFMSKRQERYLEYSEGLMNYSLNSDDVQRISSLNENYKIFLESWACPGY